MFIWNLNLKDLPEFLTHLTLNSNAGVMYSALVMCLFLLLCFAMNRETSCKVYLIDFACYKPPNSQKCSKELVMKQARQHGNYKEEELEFMKNFMERGGIGLRTDNIGILIVNCCIYNPVPSLTSMIVNRYKFRENIITYNLVGMGCTAGLLATGLAKQLLQLCCYYDVHLAVSTESITENCYVGKDRSKIIINYLFRVGGAAILLSNRPSDHNNSKYELLHAIHDNTSSSDRFYNCIRREEDNAGIIGVTINRDLLAAAIATIKPNLIAVGHLILPIREKLSYQINYIIRKLLPSLNIQQYIPNYSNAVDHFLPHVGGKPVLDDLQKTLGLSEDVMEASRMTLYRYGNTSSSSIWYELAYVEAKGRAKEDFTCYKPPTSQKRSKEVIMKETIQTGYFSAEILDFMKKTLERSGLGDSTYVAEIFLGKKYNPSMKDARREVEMTMFGAVDMLLAKTGVRCEDIGILIVNCCIYNTVPSLCSIIVNRYKFKENIITYNLVGMGCSAGLLAIGLAKQLLEVHHNSYALIVSTESITENFYLGKDRSKFLINCLFRVGGAAIILSNRPLDHNKSKYQFLHAIHTNTSSSDRSYNCILREEDNAGIVGITINKDLIANAISTIKPNLIIVGYLILPIKEKLLYIINCIARNLLPALNIQPYMPNYTKAAEHFTPHVGGKPVLDALQKTLGYTDDDMEASRMTLYRYGNTSSSSIWYELAYVEAKGRVKKGNRVWQIAYGSGFKCSSAIWRAMKTVDYDDNNPWTDEIAGLPMKLVDCGPFPVDFEPPK
ncbi:hypothetical protein L1987_59589 [Smallanthus sonchifolius]|uniref:Uncharacterized protein n=1 Tax=Smallanthus sonchifolius TaxID=185202 RepID=A0ACB9D5Y0_9ASTR|nr:hypothetical protein L1987_59589 [Smallanthus sonchifolius]